MANVNAAILHIPLPPDRAAARRRPNQVPHFNTFLPFEQALQTATPPVRALRARPLRRAAPGLRRRPTEFLDEPPDQYNPKGFKGIGAARTAEWMRRWAASCVDRRQPHRRRDAHAQDRARRRPRPERRPEVDQRGRRRRRRSRSARDRLILSDATRTQPTRWAIWRRAAAHVGARALASREARVDDAQPASRRCTSRRWAAQQRRRRAARSAPPGVNLVSHRRQQGVHARRRAARATRSRRRSRADPRRRVHVLTEKWTTSPRVHPTRTVTAGARRRWPLLPLLAPSTTAPSHATQRRSSTCARPLCSKVWVALRRAVSMAPPRRRGPWATTYCKFDALRRGRACTRGSIRDVVVRWLLDRRRSRSSPH